MHSQINNNFVYCVVSNLNNNQINKAKDFLSNVDRENFPYLKYYGRIYAYLILTLTALDQRDTCINLITETIINSLTYNFNSSPVFVWTLPNDNGA